MGVQSVSDPPVRGSLAYPASVAMWLVAVAFTIASVIGFFILLAHVPECDSLASLVRDEDCTTRNQYVFFMTGSAVSASLFAVVLFALAIILDSVARIERQIE